ncbi:histidine triad nucleotide-binding protein [Microgenomates group bacterium RBG_19FT_COMBO_39_10]|nr:MAG: histidine triad nucleotide-binding protein [Microgenomates group bacterium RBG_19FT_COMBO_39_10]
MKDCLFCKIAKKEIPSDLIYEDKEVMAFDDINPLAPVHILVIPKEHIEGLQTVKDSHQEILGKLLLTASKIAKQKKLKGYRVFFNCGKIGGQAIFHLHLHLVGGWKDLPEFVELVRRRLGEGGAI